MRRSHQWALVALLSGSAGSATALAQTSVQPLATRPASPAVMSRNYSAPARYSAVSMIADQAAAPATKAAAPTTTTTVMPYTTSACATPSCAIECEEKCYPRYGAYVDYLYLSAGDTDLVYGIPVDGCGDNAVINGPLGIVSPSHKSGFRAGVFSQLSEGLEVGVGYFQFESGINNSIVAQQNPASSVIFSPLVHPNTQSCAPDGLAADARMDIDLRMIDLDARGRIAHDCNGSGIWGVTGVRYANLKQDFAANYTILGGTSVVTMSDFDGVGPKAGLDGQLRMPSGFLTYGKVIGSLLFGEFRTDFNQSNVFAGNQVSTSLRDDRVLPVLELEAGLGWQNDSGTLRLTAGYYAGFFFNTLTTEDWIGAVRANNFNSNGGALSDTLTFHGLATRIQFSY